MRSTTLVAVLVALSLTCLSPTSQAGAGKGDATRAAYDLFETMGLSTTYGETIVKLVDVQVQSNPQLKPLRKTMLDFFEKYMGWDSIKDEMAGIYTKHFSGAEIREIQKFYKTPVGKKWSKLMPEITAQGGAIGQRRVQKHMGELQAMIEAEMARQQGGKK